MKTGAVVMYSAAAGGVLAAAATCTVTPRWLFWPAVGVSAVAGAWTAWRIMRRRPAESGQQ